MSSNKIEKTRLKALLTHHPVAEIARIVGVTRQRIHQLVKEYSLTAIDGRLAHNRRKARRQSKPPQPHIATGGVIAKLTHTTAGKVGEMLVATDLLARGWQVFLPIVNNRGHDIIAVRDQKIITIEVRPAHRTATGHISWVRKSDNQSNYYGLVVTGEPVQYEPSLDNV